MAASDSLGGSRRGKEKWGRKRYFLIAIFTSTFIAIALIISLAFLYRRHPKSCLQSLTTPAPSLLLCRPPSVDDKSASFDPSLDHISLNELAATTKGYATNAIIADDNFGSICKGRLSSDAIVIIKRHSTDAFHDRKFQAEIETVGCIHHRHLACILSHCPSAQSSLFSLPPTHG